MILQTECKKCKKPIRFYKFASTRFDISSHYKKNEIKLNCKHCNESSINHLNNVYAESKIANILALIIFIVGTPILLFLIWDLIWSFQSAYAVLMIVGILTAPSIAYTIITKNIRNKQNNFNSTWI